MPLLVGFGAVCVIIHKVLFSSVPIPLRLAILVIVLAPFNNPAFSLGGVALSDAFGLLLVVLSVFRPSNVIGGDNLVIKQLPFYLLLVASFIGFVLSFFLGYSPVLGDVDAAKIFLFSNLRLVVAFLAGSALFLSVRSPANSLFVIRVLTIAVFSILLSQLIGYLVILVFGVFPFGTFETAGFAPIPSFGAVSHERGRLGRLISFFPALLLLVSEKIPSRLLHRTLRIPLLFVVGASCFSILLTFSGSSYGLMAAFLGVSLFTSLAISLGPLKFSRVAVTSIFASLLACLVLLCCFPVVVDGLIAVIGKTLGFLFLGDGGDVRSIRTALDTQTLRAFGIGFHGSFGRDLTEVSATDLGIGVGPAYFGVFYFLFIVTILFLAARSLIKSDSVFLPVRAGAIAQFVLFYVAETSFGQYPAVAMWFLI